jgi:hypothetical protein
MKVNGFELAALPDDDLRSKGLAGWRIWLDRLIVRVTSMGFSAVDGFFFTDETETLLTGLAFFATTFAFGFNFETALRATLVFTAPFFIVGFTFATAFTLDLVLDLDLTVMTHFLQTNIETLPPHS